LQHFETRTVNIDCGRGHLSHTLPLAAEVVVFCKKTLATIPDQIRAVTDELENLFGSAPLADLARGKRGACALIYDITRLVPNHLFLRPMIDILTASGILLSQISMLFETGLHLLNEGQFSLPVQA
jgi:hypothetical protein